jgi:hypothetical protein
VTWRAHWRVYGGLSRWARGKVSQLKTSRLAMDNRLPSVRCIVASMSKALRETVFAKIIRMNSMRMLQRIGNALGYSQEFLAGRPRLPTIGENKLKLAVESTRQLRRLTPLGTPSQ